MAHFLRYYGKKRGHRRTGSPTLGKLGEAAFFAMLLAAGCAGFVKLVSLVTAPGNAQGWWIWLVFTVPLSFIVIGGGGLVYAARRWGKSAERRAARRRRIGRRESPGVDRADRRFPTVPRGVDMTNSPGTKLKFRLPMANSPGWALFGTLAFCVAWNGIVAVLAIIALRAHLTGRPIWSLTIFAAVFALIGLGAVVVFFRQFWKTLGIGPTLVEISDHPLCPGKSYRVFLSQAGRLTVNRFAVALVCEETATYRQGTDTRTESREVVRRELFGREAFKIESGLPFESEIELDVPEGAMHSFAADHNEIAWTLVVESDVAGRAFTRRAFPVVVQPCGGESHER